MIGDIWSLSVSRGSINYINIMENNKTVDPTSIFQLFYQENLKISLKSINILRNSRFLNIDVCSKIMHFGSYSIVLV